jgi:hypothetical protein
MVWKLLKKNTTLLGKKTMNDKIRQLAERSSILFDTETVPETGLKYEGAMISREDLENFAELIVQECANACLAATEPGSSVHLVSVAYADAVKKHFGVE